MYCYRFPDRETFRTLAAAEGLVTEDDDLITDSHTHSLVEVGTISRGGEWDPETGDVITPPEVLNGWHLNFVGEPPAAWDPYLIVVNHPVNVFLGGATEAPSTAVLERIAAS
jgi:hypothetical protein